MFEMDTGLLRLFSEVNSCFSCQRKDRKTDSEYKSGE